jgi:amidohydrolase
MDLNSPEISALRDEARDGLDGMIALRRTLHAHPELGNQLPHTRDAVMESLEGLPLDITLHDTTSGIAAVLEGAKPGPTVLLRGDMDALPLNEDTELDFTSISAGKMHACGHDLHTAMLMGAARMLSAHRDELAGRVLFMFQPGEEGHHGARFMLDEGLLDVGPRADGSDSPVTGAYALHVTTYMPTGWVAVKPGPAMASSDVFTIVVKGRGGHASAPHAALDPVPVACEIVQALQTMVTRRLDVFDPGVVTVGQIMAGTTSNIIPSTAEILGTIRAVSERTRTTIHDGIRRVAENVAAAHEATAEVHVELGYPVTVNNPDAAQFALATARDLLGEDIVRQQPSPTMGAEDFSYVLDRIPGAMAFLGATHPDQNPFTAAPNHSNLVRFDEDAMVNGTSLYVAMAMRHLAGAGVTS